MVFIRQSDRDDVNILLVVADIIGHMCVYVTFLLQEQYATLTDNELATVPSKNTLVLKLQKWC